jgi:hypothetical protein
LKIAVPYLLWACWLVGSALLWDAPDWPIWLIFTAGLFVLLELLTVEVNDRLFHSSSIMVVMTAGSSLLIQPDSSAVFAMTLMAGLGALFPMTSGSVAGSSPWPTLGSRRCLVVLLGLILDVTLGGIGVPTSTDLILIASASAAAPWRSLTCGK